MAFYRRLATYKDVEPYIQEFLKFLRKNGKLINNPAQDGFESFLFDGDNTFAVKRAFMDQYDILRFGRYLTTAPVGPESYIITFCPQKGLYMPTVTKGYIRLPKLSHMITLTPEDFFLLLRLIDHSKPSGDGTAISIDQAKEGIMCALDETIIGAFFEKLKVNYRMNLDYADKKWTDKNDIAAVADLEPTRENQLIAMQYFTARQNDDILYFPADSAIDLEIGDWQQLTDDYVIPQTNGLIDDPVR